MRAIRTHRRGYLSNLREKRCTEYIVQRDECPRERIVPRSDASICGLGQAAMNPVKMVLKHFREDLR